ncbi:amidohydrolase family protein [Neolewinella persica]|uniref:amidohydrolase family protein n=1 Tax=Neolewinella persica TaxID=70998 RepID=UPI0003798A0D|nr:amidohydrolase family protein [Neolewinella persica]
MTKYLLGCICSLLLMLPSGLNAQGSAEDRPPVTRAFFLNNAFVVQSPGKVIDLGGVLIRDGLIQAVGKDLKAPADAKVLEADSMYIYAGFIDGLSNLGVPKPKDDENANRGRGQREYNPSYERAGIQTERSVTKMLSAEDKDLSEMRAIGFTAAHVVPHGDMLPGQGAVILLGGKDAGKMVVSEGSSLFAQFQGASGVYPNTDMAIMSKFRELYQQARQHKMHAANYAKNARGMSRPAQNDVLEAFGPSIDGERPIFFAVDGIKEMYRAITLSKELGFPLALADVTMGQKAIPAIKASGASVFLTLDLPKAPKEDKKEEETDAEKLKLEEHRAAAMKMHEEQAAMLTKAGIPFGFSTVSAKAKEVRDNLGRMIKAGLTEDQALTALTTGPAKMLGLSNVMGTVEKGKIANLLVTDQPYFAEGANVRYVFVDGMPSEYEVKKKKKKKPGDPDVKVLAAGTWNLEIDVPMEQMASPTLTIVDDDGSLSGRLVSGMGTTEISSMSLDGNNLTFSYTTDGGGQSVTVSFDLTIDGDSLEGSMAAGSFGSFDVEGDRGPK